MNLYELDLDLSSYKDVRLPQNRLEAFRRVAVTRMYEGDLDHWHSGLVISDMMGLTKDQKALYCLVFGQSYRNHWAMIVLQQFPDLLNTKHEHIVEWHDVNWKRAFYAKDAKWNLRKFPDYVKSIKATIGNDSPYDYLERVSTVGNTAENFYSLNKSLQSMYSIGRMTAWLAQQTVYEFFDFDVDHWDLQLYSDTWSQYDSLCYLFNREDIATKRNGVKVKPAKSEINLMETNFQYLMEYINSNSNIKLDVYNIESCLCEFRKTAGAGGRKPKEFTGWTTNELADQYDALSSAWEEIDWKPYIAGLMTKGKNFTDFSLNEEYFTVMKNYGLNLNIHLYYNDEPDVHKLLSLEKFKTNSMKKLDSDWVELFSETERDMLKVKFDPTLFLRKQNIVDTCFTL